MGSSFKASSEAGTIARSETAQSRAKEAKRILDFANRANLGQLTGKESDENPDLARNFSVAAERAMAALTQSRANNERYEIAFGDLVKGGKLNLMDGTLDGKELSRDTRGAFDKTSVQRRGSNESDKDFNYESSKSQKQEGFVFAKDNNGELFAIPHTWNVNDPQGTVGIFKGDKITYSDAKGAPKEITVIGSFDNTKRGLNLAAAAAGDSLGRPMGVKQTAIVLGNKDIGERLTNQNRVSGKSNSYVYREVIDSQVVSDLNAGVSGNKGRISRLG